MSLPKPQIYCPNPNCAAPLNEVGRSVCACCQTRLIYRYLWAVGETAEQFQAGTSVAGRYCVLAPHIWLDTQPSLPPDIPPDWPDEILPYLYLYPQRLHIPEAYGFCSAVEGSAANVLLLENAPIDTMGNLCPSIAQSWPQATAVRQVYWLWQILQLWAPLLEQGVAASLLATNNIRVEGWRVRLCQLYLDEDVLPAEEPPLPETTDGPELELADLANLWLSWLESAKPEVRESLQMICNQMQTPDVQLATIVTQLNHLLLEQASQLPLRLQVTGATDTGPERTHNEDTCYPITTNRSDPADELKSRLAIVCDGIGGHEGGEVASQTAVPFLKRLVQALLVEVEQQLEPDPPDVLARQLEEIVRVVNDQIARQNDTQGREDRRRMGTTLVMALQIPQWVRRASGSRSDNGHELYLVNVGDSRAYWITQRYCQPLTVDDDVAAREVRMGRSLYREALLRPDAGALTQALGTRDSEFLRPTVQRFILEEDGLLLLCSDGLSDNGLVEQFWWEHSEALLKDKQSLEATAQAWIDLANRQNGYDNTSVVLMRCSVSPVGPDVSLPKTPTAASSEWSPASRALLENGQTAEFPEATPVSRRSKWLLLLAGSLALLLLVGGMGLAVWQEINPTGFKQFRERVFPPNR